MFYGTLKHLDSNIYAFIERYEKSKNKVLFDFIDSNNFNVFGESTGIPGNLSDPSMVLVENYQGKKLKEGAYYIIERTTLQELETQNRITNYNQTSYLIGYKIDLTDFPDEIFGKSKSLSQNERDDYFTDVWRYTTEHENLRFRSGKSVETIIRNVGQGSWNEIIEEGIVTNVFDFGTKYTASREEVIEIIGDRDVRYQTDLPGLLLSHWDVDHYHCLKGLSDEAIKSFQYFLFRNRLPNLTSRIIYGRVRDLNPNCLLPVEPFDKPPKGERKHLRRLNVDDQFLLYNSCYTSSRNKDGLCLSLRLQNSNIVFPGDNHYDQISYCMLPELNYESNHYLVVPHHGGNAGKLIYQLGRRAKPAQAIISVGSNSYGHPFENNKEGLRKLGFKVQQTMYSGEVKIKLSE